MQNEKGKRGMLMADRQKEKGKKARGKKQKEKCKKQRNDKQLTTYRPKITVFGRWELRGCVLP